MLSDRFGNWLERQRARPRKWGVLAAAFLGLLVLLNVAVLHPLHPHFDQERIPGFWAVFGLGVCAAMVLVMKGFVGKLLGVSEDFYDRDK